MFQWSHTIIRNKLFVLSDDLVHKLTAAKSIRSSFDPFSDETSSAVNENVFIMEPFVVTHLKPEKKFDFLNCSSYPEATHLTVDGLFLKKFNDSLAALPTISMCSYSLFIAMSSFWLFIISDGVPFDNPCISLMTGKFIKLQSLVGSMFKIKLNCLTNSWHQ